MKILAISGSLRRQSSNTTLLRAGALLTPARVEIVVYAGIGDLPHFNPDREEEDIPAVADLRAHLDGADAVLFSTPEYAHGVPGVLKNALDWVVGSGELIDKPVALWNPSPHSTYAVTSLTETLTVMSARVISAACVTLPLRGKTLDENTIAADPAFAEPIKQALQALIPAIDGRE